VPNQRLHPTGLSGRLAKVVEPANEAWGGGLGPEPPGG